MFDPVNVIIVNKSNAESPKDFGTQAPMTHTMTPEGALSCTLMIEAYGI